MQKKRSIHSPGSPSTLDGPRLRSNPDGLTPAELPSAPRTRKPPRKTIPTARKTA